MMSDAVHPHLEYCTVAWSAHYLKDKELLEHVQRRFSRIIPELKVICHTLKHWIEWMRDVFIPTY